MRDLSLWQWFTLVAAGGMTVALVVLVNAVVRMDMTDRDARVRTCTRLLRSVGVWQVVLALNIIAMGYWVSAVSLLLMGPALILGGGPLVRHVNH